MKYFIWLSLLLCFSAVTAQENTDTATLLLKARAYDQRIVLRWVPADYAAWQWGNKAGYRIERFTLATPTGPSSAAAIRQSRTVLAEGLRPLPETDWEALADTNQTAIIAAGALYSDSFAVSDQGDETATMVSENSTAENRYGFGLFAADQFLEVAQGMGLAYIDEKVSAGMTYLYEVSFRQNPPDRIAPPAQHQIAADARVHLVPPVDLSAEWRNQKVMLGWNRQLVDTLYTAYFVEKSVDQGQTFFRANTLPLVYFSTAEEATPYMYYLDTLSDNETEHYYRVRGKTPFGELGPPSRVIMGKGIPPPFAYLPRITRMDEVPEGGGLQLHWAIRDTLLDEIAGFHLYRSIEKDATPQRLNTSLLAPDSRVFVDPTPRHAHYYQIAVVDIHGNEAHSYSKIALLQDDSPPAPPTGLRAQVETTGLATLQWTANTEEDLQGYRVYTANIEDGNYVELTHLPIIATRFQHRFSMNTLHETEYFKLRAIDLRGNYSDYSIAVEAVRPDTKPPTPPTLKNIRSDTKAIYLEWAVSSSEDVVHQLVQRRAPSSMDWTTLTQLPKNVQVHVDSSAQRGQDYSYRLMAVDKAGWSAASQILQASRIDDGQRGLIEEWSGHYLADQGAVQLQWRYAESALVKHYLLYRAANDAELTVYKKITPSSDLTQQGETIRYQDQKVRADQQYRYRLLAIQADQAFSNLTEPITITTQ